MHDLSSSLLKSRLGEVILEVDLDWLVRCALQAGAFC